jgi:subtilisin family serine protease
MKPRRFGRRFIVTAAVALSFGAAGALAISAAAGPVPDVSSLQVPASEIHGSSVSPALLNAQGTVRVWVRLSDAPLAVAVGPNAKQKGSNLTPGQQRAYLQQLARAQDSVVAQISNLGGRELARVSKADNAIAVSVDASKLKTIATLPGVTAVNPVVNYELTLSDVRHYIGADAVEAAGFDGSGITVGVLDTGVDYTHEDFGGPGTLAAYLAAYGTTTGDPANKSRDGLFPTSKVVEGHDFVGEAWPSGPLSPDDDPIDCGAAAIPAPCAGGHGTHTADIVAGHSLDNAHKGIAPGADLVSVKVCSSISTSCSGVAMLQGMDFALDPNQDGDISDAVDVISMSIGSSYGQIEDDISESAQNAVAMGVVFVASAGNSADRPYIVGSPSIAPRAISVAATFHPTSKLYLVHTPTTTDKGAVWQSWSAAPVLTSGTLVYDTTNAATRLGCTNAAGGNPWAPGSHAGETLLIDRGTCAVSLKVANAASAGAIAAVVANNVSQPTCDLPPSFSYGGGAATIPGYTITQADGNSLKTSALGTTATIDPSTAAPLVGNMASFSSRGPSYSNNMIKPDIGAVGTDIQSAEVGTGTGETPFAGTSASAPVVAGSAALLLDAHSTRTPMEVKSVLMNTAEANIGLNPIACPGVGAPISRIGDGDVRVKRAVDSTTAAWDADDLTASLSFGYRALTASTDFQKTVVVRNYGGSSRTYSISPSFRYADDAASGAVAVTAPASITVPANGSKTFKVKLSVDVTKLPIWTLNGGSRGGDGFRLQGVEFDGYISIADATDNVHLAWHILPHRAAAVTPASTSVTLSGGSATLNLSNATGAVDGRVDVFSLLGTSGRMPPPSLPGPGDNAAVIDLKSIGARLVSTSFGPGVQVAVDTFGTRSHPAYPAEFDVYIDSNRDGTPDAVMFNTENGGFAVTGQSVIAAGPLPSGPFTAFFFNDADLDSGNAILTAPLSALGLTPGTQFDMSVFGCDNYFTGLCTDAITGKTYTANTPRYVGSGVPLSGVPAGGSSTLNISAVPGGDVASPSQTGLLLMYRDGRTQREADQIAVTP